jgi:hypothetical protein
MAKTFALLASTFRYAMLMNPDTSLMQSPTTLLDSKKFSESGILFWHGRTATHHLLLLVLVREWHQSKSVDFVKSLLTDPEIYSSLKFINGVSSHEQDAGLLLIDKTKHLTGIMAACKLLDSERIRSAVLEQNISEDEIFWLGLAIDI